MSPANRLAHAAAAACHTVGSTLHADPGWRTRGHGKTPPDWRAVMWHDTVTGPSWPRHQLTSLLVRGHPHLAGPIANVQLERHGDAVLIAAGRAYHAGPGSDPLGANIQAGNLHTVGLEAANRGAGSGERWTDVQYRWAVAFTAALDVPALGHLEWAPDRKLDPWSVDMAAARRDVTRTRQEDEMNPQQQAMLEQAARDAAIARQQTAEILKVLGGRQVGDDLRRIRLTDRAIAAAAGLATEHDVPDGPVPA